MHAPIGICFAHATTMVLNKMMMDHIQSYQVCYVIFGVFLPWLFCFFSIHGSGKSIWDDPGLSNPLHDYEWLLRTQHKSVKARFLDYWDPFALLLFLLGKSISPPALFGTYWRSATLMEKSFATWEKWRIAWWIGIGIEMENKLTHWRNDSWTLGTLGVGLSWHC